MHDVIVIGAGIGGLAAAVDLAASGRSVLVLEAAERAGGKAGIEVFDGVEVDTGPSVLTMPDVFDALFRRAGTSLEEQITLRPSNPGFRYRYPDGVVLDVFHDLEATLASVGDTLGTKAKKELASFMAYAQTIWDTAAPVFVYGDAPNMRNVLGQGLAVLAKMTKVDPWSTMGPAIDKRVRSPHLRSLLRRYATYNGSDPRSAPATLNCIAHVELALGGWGIEGGIYALVRALVSTARRLGVELETGARVGEIVVDGGRARGVVLADGRRLDAVSVVANADAAHVVEGLLPRKVKHGIPMTEERSMSGFNAVVRARRRDRVPHEVVFPADYAAEFVDIFDRGRPPSDPTVYVCAQEVCHGRSGWADHEPLFVMANAPAEPVRGESDDRTWEQLQGRVQRCLLDAGIVEAEDETLWQRDPRVLARRFPGSRGAIYGASSNGTTAAFQRPPNVVPKVDGLFLASGSAHPGGGVPLAALSGRAAARAIEARTEPRAGRSHPGPAPPLPAGTP